MVLRLEVFRVLELQVEGEEDVEGLDAVLVDRDVQQPTDDVHVLGQVTVQLGAGQRHAAQELLHLGGPLLHQGLYVGHGPGVVDAGRGLTAMELRYALYPAVQGLLLLVGAADTAHLLHLQEESRGQVEGGSIQGEWSLESHYSGSNIIIGGILLQVYYYIGPGH